MTLIQHVRCSSLLIKSPKVNYFAPIDGRQVGWKKEVQAVCRCLLVSCSSWEHPVVAAEWAVASLLPCLRLLNAEELKSSLNLGMEAAICAMAHPGAAVGLQEHPQGPAAEAFPSHHAGRATGRCSVDISNHYVLITINCYCH